MRQGEQVTEQPPRRPLRPAPVLPPPQVPGGQPVAPGYGDPSSGRPFGRDPQGYAAPGPHPYEQYHRGLYQRSEQRTYAPPPPHPGQQQTGYPQPPTPQPYPGQQQTGYPQPSGQRSYAPPPFPPQPYPPQSYPAPHHYLQDPNQIQPPPAAPYWQGSQQQWLPGHPQPLPAWGQRGYATPAARRSGSLAKIVLGLVGGAAALLFALIIVSAALGTTGSTQADVIDHSPAEPSDADTSPLNPGDAQAVLTANPLYTRGGLVNGKCPAEDLGDASKDEQTRFYSALLDCLDQEWSAPVEEAGFRHTEPGLVVFDSPITTPCGSASPEKGRTLAFYCTADEVLYADVPQMRKFFGAVDVAYAVVIGHEFGHHVQREIGILDAFEAEVYDDYEQRLDLSRRVELQASCMGGLFLGAIADTFPVDDDRLIQLDRAAASFGDEPGAPENQRDHGSSGSNRTWILAAFNDNDLATCNTFVAPASEVD